MAFSDEEDFERAKNDQIHQFADAFGADGCLLRGIMSHPVTAATLNQFNRFEGVRFSLVTSDWPLGGFPLGENCTQMELDPAVILALLP